VSTAVSPMVRHSLGALPSSLPHSHPASAPLSAKLISPQITKWFRKSTARKLAVTPKKSSSAHGAKSNISGVKRKLCSEPDTDDSLGVTHLGVKQKVRRASRENDPKLSPSKPQRTEPSPAMTVLSPVESNCTKQSEQVLGNEQVLGKALTDASMTSNTAQSSVTSRLDSAATSFRSPTVNLPNYVYDPQPRAPVGRHSSPVKHRQSRDWLTQLRLERQNKGVSSSPPTDRGQVRHKTTKTLKSSRQVNPSDPVKLSVSKMSPLNTAVVSNILFFIHFLCLVRLAMDFVD